MVKYHANVSPRTLTTVRDGDYIRNFPARWELLRWYKCWRKLPYPSDIIAFLIAEERPGYLHYQCPFGEPHWHIGRGGNKADPKHLLQRAKRVYRKAVRDEIWAEHEQKQQEQEAAQPKENSRVAVNQTS